MMNIQTYLQTLDENSDTLMQKLKALTATQLNSRLAEGWTVMQVAEHILLTEMMVRKILLRPSDQQHLSETVLGGDKLRKIMVDLRSRKVKTSASFEPNGRWQSVPEFEKAFTTARSQLVDDLLKENIKVTPATYKHPVLGEMTVEDWLYFILHHAERHLHQMDDILTKDKP